MSPISLHKSPYNLQVKNNLMTLDTLLKYKGTGNKDKKVLSDKVVW